MKFLDVIIVIWWHSRYFSGKYLFSVLDATEPHDVALILIEGTQF